MPLTYRVNVTTTREAHPPQTFTTEPATATDVQVAALQQAATKNSCTLLDALAHQLVEAVQSNARNGDLFMHLGNCDGGGKTYVAVNIGCIETITVEILDQ